MPPADTKGPEGFRQTDFDIDEHEQHVTSPVGQSDRVWSVSKGKQIQIRFDGKTVKNAAISANVPQVLKEEP